MEINKTLFIGAVAALAAINIASLTIGGALIAVLLVIIALAVVRWKRVQDYGLYSLLVAEASLLGLNASIRVALVYQALSLCLLAAALSSFAHERPFSEYRSPLVKMTAGVAAFVAVTGVTLSVVPFGLSGPQLCALITGGALLLFCLVLAIEHFSVRLPNFNASVTKP